MNGRRRKKPTNEKSEKDQCNYRMGRMINVYLYIPLGGQKLWPRLFLSFNHLPSRLVIVYNYGTIRDEYHT